MAYSTLPSLPGLSWSVVRRPIWKTLVQESVSGKEARASLMSYPLYEWELTYELLRADSNAELQTLLGFINECAGMSVPFLYTDPHDYTIANQNFGTGDGNTTQFQLVRVFGGFVEPVQSVNAITNIKIAGATTTAYTLGSTGIITFNTLPTNGAALTWTGTYYWLCRFLDDQVDFEEFMYNLFQLKKLQFRYWKQ